MEYQAQMAAAGGGAPAPQAQGGWPQYSPPPAGRGAITPNPAALAAVSVPVIQHAPAPQPVGHGHASGPHAHADVGPAPAVYGHAPPAAAAPGYGHAQVAQQQAPPPPPAGYAQMAPGPAPQPAPGAAPPVSQDTSAGARIVAILKDGSEGRAFVLSGDQTDVGRTEGNIVLSEDPYLSPRHARITRRAGRYYIRDLDTTNGTFVRLRDAVELKNGDVFLMGQQVLVFEVLSEAETPLGPAMQHGVLLFGTPEVARVARIIQRTTEGLGRDVHYLHREETVLGRETGDIVFTDDPFLSRRHASVSHDRAARRFLLRDLGSSNGTSVLFRGEQPLAHGDQFRVGHHLFRFELLSNSRDAAGSGSRDGAGGGGS